MNKKVFCMLGFLLLAPAAFAQGKSFDVLGGFTPSQGQSALRMGIGAPGFETMFAYGITSSFSVGGLLGLNWGELADFTLRFQIPLRFSLYDSGKLGVAIGFAPGVAVFLDSQTIITIPLHFDLSTGFRITPELSVLTAFEVPLELWTKGEFNAWIPLGIATGLEYHITSSVKLWSRIRTGHRFFTRSVQGMSGPYLSGHVGVAFGF